ncbi:MAG: hypothetical protein KDD53_10195, partial [Bdellovibrionales bacterium]|nr:hypothetical protein [Bdellovibrionales bacterium]
NGKFKRLVPFMDIEGGRLDYLRNDLLYFTESLKWQRLRGEPKFIGNDPSKPGYRTIRLANLVALLDACLTGMNHPRTYKALVFFRKRKQVQRFEVWDAAQLTSEMDLNIDQNTINKYQNRWECKNAFELTPGQFGSGKREQETIAKIQELQAERSMVADARS